MYVWVYVCIFKPMMIIYTVVFVYSIIYIYLNQLTQFKPWMKKIRWINTIKVDRFTLVWLLSFTLLHNTDTYNVCEIQRRIWIEGKYSKKVKCKKVKFASAMHVKTMNILVGYSRDIRETKRNASQKNPVGPCWLLFKAVLHVIYFLILV